MLAIRFGNAAAARAYLASRENDDMNNRTGRSRIARAASKLLTNLPSDLMNISTSSWHFRLVVDVGTDDPLIVGTAFPVDPNTLVTAKHVITEVHNATEHMHLDRTLVAVQVLPGNRFISWQITEIRAHETADLMLLCVDPKANRHNPPLWVPPWRIRRTAPRRGEWAMAIGYVEGTLRISSRNPNGGGVIEISDKGQMNFGIVKTVYKEKRDSVMLPCPCFEVGANFGAGMSGGPVFDKRGRLCGIVASGVDSIEELASSFAVTLWPSLSYLYGDSFYISSSGMLAKRHD